MFDDPAGRVRAVSLAFPEASEKTSWGTVPTFRVRDKIFVMIQDDHHGGGRLALWCKAKPGVQEMLIASQPDRFFRPPYVGHISWVGIHLDVDLTPDSWEEIEDLIIDTR
jgi:hypothetical protein